MQVNSRLADVFLFKQDREALSPDLVFLFVGRAGSRSVVMAFSARYAKATSYCDPGAFAEEENRFINFPALALSGHGWRELIFPASSH